MIKDMDIKRGYQKIVKRDEVTIIAKGCNILGELTSESDMKIAGTVNGNIAAEADITIEESAVIKGNIEAKNVHIKGQVYGDVTAVEGVRLDSKSRLEGNIVYGTISIEKGAFFSGTGKTAQREFEIEVETDNVLQK